MEENPVFLTLENPVVVGILVFVIIVILIYIFSKYFYFPLVKKYFEDKKKNSLISKILFETDPNPLFRVDFNGNLLQKNHSFDKLINFHQMDFFSFYNRLKKDTNFETSEGQFEFQIKNSFYEIIVKRIIDLKALQVYIKDITAIKEKENLVEDYKRKVIQIKAEQEKKFLEKQNEISRELHDSINHNLLFTIKKIEKQYSNLPELVELNNIFSNIRDCSKNIKPINFEIDDFSYTIYDMAEKIKKSTNLKLEVSLTKHINEINSRVLLHLYRIIQELISNATKYANAKYMDINLYKDQDNFYLTVEDDGIGFVPTKIAENHYSSSGLGIINIQERINEISAKWSIDSEVGRGTVFIIEFSVIE